MIEGCDDAQRNLCLSGRLMTMMQINLSLKTQWLVDELSYYQECLWENQPTMVGENDENEFWEQLRWPSNVPLWSNWGQKRVQ